MQKEFLSIKSLQCSMPPKAEVPEAQVMLCWSWLQLFCQTIATLEKDFWSSGALVLNMSGILQLNKYS